MELKKNSIDNLGGKNDLASCDQNLTTYINTVVAYNFLYNEYLEDLGSKQTEIIKRAEKCWQENVNILEKNIKTAYQKLVSENSKYVGSALQILENTTRDSKKINLFS